MRRAFTLAEALIGIGLFALLAGLIAWLITYGARTTGRLTPQLALQQESHRAVVRTLAELQEGMEVIAPRPGATLPYALVRDRLSLIRWYYQLPAPSGNGFELWRYVDDPALEVSARKERVLGSVRRLSFSSRTEGALQLNLLLAEGEAEYALLTTVRLRNIASAEEIW